MKRRIISMLLETSISLSAMSINSFGNISYSSTLDYLVENNGVYNFVVVDKTGNSVTKSFTVSNIDKQAPLGVTPSIATNQNWIILNKYL